MIVKTSRNNNVSVCEIFNDETSLYDVRVFDYGRNMYRQMLFNMTKQEAERSFDECTKAYCC